MPAQLSATTLVARIPASGLVLEVQRAEITQDENWTPFVQATLDCAARADQWSALLALNPAAADITVELTITQRYGDTDPLSTLTSRFAGQTLAALTTAYLGFTLAKITADYYRSFNGLTAPAEPPYVRVMQLLMRSRNIDRETSAATITVASVDSVLSDAAHVDTVSTFPPGATLPDLINWVLGTIGREVFDLDVDVQFLVVTEALREWKPGVTAHAYLTEHVRHEGLKLWANETGLWRLRYRPPFTPAIGVISPSTNMLGSVDRISRDGDWYSAVVLTYEWTDALGVQQRAVDVARQPGSLFPRVLAETRTVPYPGPGMAAALLRTGTGQNQTDEIPAVADYSLIIGQRINIQMPPAADRLMSLSRITWQFPDDTMTIRTRSTIDY